MLPAVLCVDQIMIYDLHCSGPEVVHPLHPNADWSVFMSRYCQTGNVIIALQLAELRKGAFHGTNAMS